jgi:hypothetical protein
VAGAHPGETGPFAVFDDGLEIAFRVRIGAEISSDQNKLRADVEDTLTVVRILFPPLDGEASAIKPPGLCARFLAWLRGDGGPAANRPPGQTRAAAPGSAGQTGAAGTQAGAQATAGGQAGAAGPTPADVPLRLDPRFVEYKRELLLLAQLGLEFAPQYLQVGQSALNELRAKVVRREAGRIKNAYMFRLGRIAVLVAALLIFGRWIVAGALEAHGHVDWALYRYRNFALLLVGAAIGTWLSFALRKVILTFTDLEALEIDRVNPFLRVMFVASLSLVVGLIFSTGMVNLQIGGFGTDLIHSGSFALLIGLFCGIGEQALAVSVRKRADEFVGRIGGETTGA